MVGTIKMVDLQKKFGFIRCSDGNEFFFHMSNFEGDFESLERGLKVEFEVAQGPKGARGEKVKLLV